MIITGNTLRQNLPITMQNSSNTGTNYHLLKVNTEKQYYNKYFFQNINDDKRIWMGIKQIVTFKPQTSQRLIRIVYTSAEITEPKLVADAFNNYYFSNIGKKVENENTKCTQ